MPKISALPPMTTADAADEAPIVDTSATTTKKWTLTLLKSYLQSLVGWLTTAMIADNAVTAVKLATTAIKIGKAQVTSTVNLNTSYADIISVTVTVPSGGRDLLLVLSYSQAQGSGGTERGEIRLMEGSTIYQRYYHGFKNPGLGGTFQIIIPAPSAGSHTYKVNGKMDIGTAGLFYADATGSPLELQAYMV